MFGKSRANGEGTENDISNPTGYQGRTEAKVCATGQIQNVPLSREACHGKSERGIRCRLRLCRGVDGVRPNAFSTMPMRRRLRASMTREALW